MSLEAATAAAEDGRRAADLKVCLALGIQVERIQKQLQAAKKAYGLTRPFMAPQVAEMKLTELNEGLQNYRRLKTQLELRMGRLHDPTVKGSRFISALPTIDFNAFEQIPAAPPTKETLTRARALLDRWVAAWGADARDLQLDVDSRAEPHLASLLLFDDADLDELGVGTPAERAELRRAVRVLLDNLIWKRHVRVDHGAA